MIISFTDQRARAIKPTERRQDYRDKRVPELRLRVSPTGRKVWRLRVSIGGRWESKVIGVFQEHAKAEIDMGARDARHEARRELALAGKSGSINQREAKLANMPTLGKWWEKFEKDNPRRYSLQTMADHGYRMKKYIAPALGSKRLHEITSAKLEDLTLDVEKKVGARTANFCRSLVSILLNWAEDRGVMPEGYQRPTCKKAEENPVRDDNFIPIAKAPQFAAALAELRTHKSNGAATGNTAADIIWLGILTGARKSNLFQMAWSEIDWSRAVWIIPASKYKTRKKTNAGATIPLVPQAVAILEQRRASAKDSPWVFPSNIDPTQHIDNINRSWQWFREKVGITKVSFHGLRHTLGTWQGHLGANQKMIAASLGQKDLASTDRYVHADTEIVRGNMARAIEASFTVVETDPQAVQIALSAEQWEQVLDAMQDSEAKETLAQAVMAATDENE